MITAPTGITTTITTTTITTRMITTIPMMAITCTAICITMTMRRICRFWRPNSSTGS
jgi:hypothetical protein